MKNQTKNEKGLGLGVSIIVILVVLMVVPFFFDYRPGPFRRDFSTLFTGVYLQFWGILFLLSYYFSHKTFFFRGLIWVCENLSFPRGRKMALCSFALFFGLGTIALLYGIGLFQTDRIQSRISPLPPGVEPIESWWYKDPLLYIVIAIIIAGGYYRYKTSKKK